MPYDYNRRESRSVQHPDFKKLDTARKAIEDAVSKYKKLRSEVKNTVGESVFSVSTYADIPIVEWRRL